MHTHRASATGWRGKRETLPQHSSVFISAPPVGLNCAWSWLASIRTWGKADPQRNTRATQCCEAEHKLGKRHIGLRLQQEAGERPLSTSHVSLRQNEMAPSNTWESPAHCTCPGLMVMKKARQPWPLRDFKLPLKVFRNVHLYHRESCAEPSSPGWKTAAWP